MNWPESQLSFTSANACTIRSWPQTQPIRQPIMSKPLDMRMDFDAHVLRPGHGQKAVRRAGRR